MFGAYTEVVTNLQIMHLLQRQITSQHTFLYKMKEKGFCMHYVLMDSLNVYNFPYNKF